MSRTYLDTNSFPVSAEHGKVVRATREWGCNEAGFEYFETWLKYEDNFVESVDYSIGETYDF